MAGKREVAPPEAFLEKIEEALLSVINEGHRALKEGCLSAEDSLELAESLGELEGARQSQRFFRDYITLHFIEMPVDMGRMMKGRKDEMMTSIRKMMESFYLSGDISERVDTIRALGQGIHSLEAACDKASAAINLLYRLDDPSVTAFPGRG